jgi:hypothetical protein
MGNSLLLYVLTGNDYLTTGALGPYFKKFAWFYGTLLCAILTDCGYGLATIVAVAKGIQHPVLLQSYWHWAISISMQLSYCGHVACSGMTASKLDETVGHGSDL